MTISIKRFDLYEEIWSHGITKTAEKYNMTAVKLKSAMADNDIPIPNQSYWLNMHMGKEVKRQSLPDPSNNVEINIKERNVRINSKNTKRLLSDNAKAQKGDKTNFFSNIELSDGDSVNEALMNIKIPPNCQIKCNTQ